MFDEIIKKWGGHEVSAMQVYTDLFGLGEGLIQRQDEEPGEFKSNPLGYWKNDGEQRGHRRILFDDTFEETLKEMQEADFSIMNGLTYFGKRIHLQVHTALLKAIWKQHRQNYRF